MVDIFKSKNWFQKNKYSFLDLSKNNTVINLSNADTNVSDILVSLEWQ